MITIVILFVLLTNGLEFVVLFGQRSPQWDTLPVNICVGDVNLAPVAKFARVSDFRMFSSVLLDHLQFNRS